MLNDKRKILVIIKQNFLRLNCSVNIVSNIQGNYEIKMKNILILKQVILHQNELLAESGFLNNMKEKLYILMRILLLDYDRNASLRKYIAIFCGSYFIAQSIKSITSHKKDAQEFCKTI